MKQKLKSLDEFERLKNELSILKQSEFEVDQFVAESYTLEKLMSEKNTRLQAENAGLKSELDEHKRKIESFGTQVEKSESQIEAQRLLISKLEEDLSKVNDQLSQQKVRYFNFIMIAVYDLKSSSEPTESAEKSDESVLAILTSQRDRYRQKNLELEEAQRALNQHITGLKNELEALKVDNVKLFEKLQYTQSFGGAQSSRPQVTLRLSNFFTHFFRQKKSRLRSATTQRHIGQIMTMTPYLTSTRTCMINNWILSKGSTDRFASIIKRIVANHLCRKRQGGIIRYIQLKRLR